MTENKISIEWRVIGETVPGASHLRAGIPNQDSLLYVRESSRALPIALSVSDGHGSPKCFRSDRGSQFAVKKAAFLISEFLDERRGKFDLAEIENYKEQLSKEFVKRWREAVEADLKKEPFTEKEFENLEKKSGAEAKKLVDENPFLAYGATSLTVAVEEDFILYLQLGDGDILNISAAGEVTKPLSEDPRLLANETTSLCLPKAEKDFRFHVQKISDTETPALILLSTDGYLNSFSSEAGFFQAGTDILQMLSTENGFNDVSDNLKAWLEEATQMGSGDDCTVAVIYRPDLLKKPENSEQAKEVETITTEVSPSPETSEAIAALTDSDTISPESMEDVTVTITIKKDKKDKNKQPSPEIHTQTAAADAQLKDDKQQSEKEAR
jgi:hypothetical protein